MSSAAITSGAIDSTSPEANVVIANGCLEAGCVRGSGVALTPLIYMTANHSVTGTLGGDGPVQDLSARVGIAVVNQDKKRPPATRKASAMSLSVPDDTSNDVALVFLDPASLDNPASKPLLRVHMTRPSFQIPQSTQVNGVYTFNPSVVFAGFAVLGVRYSAFASTFALNQTATGAYWTLDAPPASDPGDSGGGLSSLRADLTRDTFALVSGGTVVEGVGTTTSYFADLTNPTMSAWIRSHAVDPISNHTATWSASHPPPVGHSDRWYGDVDYTGPCDTVNDPDCDGWYSTPAKGQHDNCPGLYNPSQRDADDDGYGDACPCPCDPAAGFVDYDGDGKCAVACAWQETDNCPKVSNKLQENCNLDAELAHSQAVLGDACDPVPCPASAPVTNLITSGTCAGNAQIGGSCSGRKVSSRIDTTGLASHRVDGDSVLGTTDFGTVAGVTSSMRFCQSNKPSGFDCSAPTAIADSHLTEGASGEVLDSSQPWHRVIQGTCTNNCLTIADDARGQTYLFDYTDQFHDTHGWEYATDNSYWTINGLIPSPGAYAGCPDSAKFGAGTCLDGTWWSHANTPVGDSQSLVVNGIVMGTHGAQLANHYFDVRPDATYSFQYAGVGIWHRIFLWRTLPDPWERSLVRQTRYVVSNPSGGQLGILASDGTSEQVPPEVPSGAPVPIFSSALQTVLHNLTNVWASAVEPSPVLGMIDRRVEAVLLSSDGTQTPDLAMNDHGVLRTRAELGFPDFVTRTTIAHPAPRTGFLSFYSSAAGGVFMMGGTDGMGTPMHDLWFRGIADDWRPVPLASSYTADRIVASTFSFADQKLYVMDHTLGTGGGATDTLRLARFDRAGGVEVLGTCARNATFPAQYLTVDNDGSILVTSTNATSSQIGHLAVGANGAAYFSQLDTTEGPLVAPPIVDPNGYSLLASAPASGATLTMRKTQLSYGVSGSYSFCALLNGGFETGDLSGWTASGASQTITRTARHSGTYSARLGSTGITNGDSTISQTFTVPQAGASLSFWYSNSCPDTVTYDWFVAELRNTAGVTLATIVPRTCAATTAWAQATFSLTPYAGQDVVLLLSSHDDNYPGDPTYTRIDDVGFQ